MRKNILVIGGTRYFGKLLVQRLVLAGHRVTVATRGYAPDPFGKRIERIRVDRRNETAMRAAFRDAGPYDLIYDQVCHSPLDAAISVRTFAGRTRRYIMTSTVEAYSGLPARKTGPFAEQDLNVLAQPIDSAYPWHDPSRSVESYVSGKVQAEAYLYRDGSLPLVTVRLGNVLGGPPDFTGRLAHFVDLVRAGAPLRYTSVAAKTSFIAAYEAADFMAWAGTQSFTGPVNAASGGAMSAWDIYRRTAELLDARPHGKRGAATGTPFDYPQALVLDTSRAKSLGYRFGHIDEWLDDAILQHDLAYV